MRPFVFFLLLFIETIGIVNAQDVVPIGFLYRVKKMAVGPASGTAFIVEVDNRQYLITAKHVVATISGDQGDVELFVGDGRRETLQVKILRCEDPIDIAVLVPRSPLIATVDPVLVSNGNVTFSQDVFFVGFPYGDDGLSTRFEDAAFGFIRKATMSAMRREKGGILMFLDGINNGGFSGGPVVYRDLNEPARPLKVIGVISAYRSDVTVVKKMMPIQAWEVTAEDKATNRVAIKDGQTFRLVDTDSVVLNNSGIVHAYGINAAFDLIRANGGPGPEVKSAN